MTVEIPYPAVFHDWQDRDVAGRSPRRVATGTGAAGVFVEVLRPDHAWQRVELTERDACLLAAALLRNAGEAKLSKRVLRRLERGDVK